MNHVVAQATPDVSARPPAGRSAPSHSRRLGRCRRVRCCTDSGGRISSTLFADHEEPRPEGYVSFPGRHRHPAPRGPWRGGQGAGLGQLRPVSHDPAVHRGGGEAVDVVESARNAGPPCPATIPTPVRGQESGVVVVVGYGECSTPPVACHLAHSLDDVHGPAGAGLGVPARSGLDAPEDRRRRRPCGGSTARRGVIEDAAATGAGPACHIPTGCPRDWPGDNDEQSMVIRPGRCCCDHDPWEWTAAPIGIRGGLQRRGWVIRRGTITAHGERVGPYPQ